MRRPAGAPRLLLSARSLSGLTRAPRERMLEITARFHEPESLAVAVSKAIDAGAEGVLATPTRPLRAALAELDKPVPLYAVLPDFPQGELHDFGTGVDGLLEKRLARVGPAARLRMHWARWAHAPAFSQTDMAARLMMLLEAESGSLPRKGVRGIVVAAPVTDLALAAGSRAFFERTTRFVRRRFRAAAGFETANLGHLLARLREWGEPPDFVVGPVNPRGLGMKPSASETLLELSRAIAPVVAVETRAGGLCTLEEGARWARQRGAHGVAPDLAEMDDVAGELKRVAALAPAPGPVAA